MIRPSYELCCDRCSVQSGVVMGDGREYPAGWVHVCVRGEDELHVDLCRRCAGVMRRALDRPGVVSLEETFAPRRRFGVVDGGGGHG